MPKANAQPAKDRRTSGDVTRQRLLSASASLIVERGWSGVTTRTVAERAGVNQALVHYHFGSIDDLRREAVMSRLLPAIQGLADELLDERPLPESIHRVMQVIDHFDLQTEIGVLMAEALLQATRDPSVAEAMGGVLGSWSEMLGPRLVVAQERGVVRADIPAERLTPLLAAFLDGLLIQRMADPDFDSAAAAETLIALLDPIAEDAP
jgi:AcrR family transcriptional regulator